MGSMKILLISFIYVKIFTLIFAYDLQHTDVVLLGGTGDLAKKYLWQGFFYLFQKYSNENSTFSFTAIGRTVYEEGNTKLREILTGNVKCGKENNEACEEKKSEFISLVKYSHLKTEDEYKTFCQNFSKKEKSTRNGHIFYLSLPPSAYVSTLKTLSKYCYRNDDQIWTRFVLEKPFGRDLESAQQQANTIAEFVRESDLFRIDHYLGKPVVKQILSFRKSNKQTLEPLLNRQYVDRIEIIMKETIGVKDRTEFYNQVGVIRDVMQNHLSELLALVTMELPRNLSNSKELEEQRTRLLIKVRPVRESGILTGQYSKYLEEAIGANGNLNQSKYTPTFAAALLRIENSRWTGVPLILMSGKMLDERSSYIRILFRERVFCVTGCTDRNSTHMQYPRQLIFQIGHGDVPSPGILVSKSLFKPVWSPGVTELSITSKDSLIHGQRPGDFHYAVSKDKHEAYESLIEDIYLGRKESFVTLERLLLLWKIWSPVLKSIETSVKRIYKEGADHSLNFRIDNDHLVFISDSQFDIPELENSIVHDVKQIISPTDMQMVPSMFMGENLVCKDLIFLFHSLAERIKNSAEMAVQNRNVFHLALSGGNSPVPLFQILAEDSDFPWSMTHIWQVDERCVSKKSDKSNFLSIYQNLIHHIKIPFFNIHFMPVDINGRICEESDKGDNQYEDAVKYILDDLKFDMILLGLGTDGHTASLFPGEKYSRFLSENKLVAYTKSNDQSHRMSLLLPLINKAREVIVLVTGKSKHGILQKLSEITSNNSELPITFVKPTDGNLTWYIDYGAWIG
ncbi:hypothetical protein CHS0354_013193 [Potamilus streckersoni]|uniref:Glucose-6-phosphate 1-dehydrogenase n=1 Tax=Potamilus streckersoni TaxID=2493646 RepID=A0AAE0W9M5_9BIVA|nr:hypothetical protein CHS0354_013193 [Potamilus streckersoni]